MIASESGNQMYVRVMHSLTGRLTNIDSYVESVRAKISLKFFLFFTEQLPTI